VLAVIVLVLGMTMVMPSVALAVVEPPGEGAGAVPASSNAVAPQPTVCTALPIFRGGAKCVSNNPAQGGAIIVYLKDILKFLGGAVGAVIVLMLIIAGIQYIVAFGDPGGIKNAKGRIVNAITALVLYLMMFAILNFLIPGGIFG
jgi:hypothetical protein